MQLHYGIDDLMKIDIWSFLPIILPILIIGALLIFIALVDLFRHRDTRKNVLIWTFVILFVNTLGPILYFILGRKDRETL
ncbi:PLD nuclease N-terminal domain-containing protein [Solibacillus sp. FSL R7-0668]|uniref:PLD nuclease N-terminal domain-containing protein n=1 Tax=Solibacillus sp. FSL R7-0668 TaxID=2921688 RepID=UPI0030FBB2D3